MATAIEADEINPVMDKSIASTNSTLSNDMEYYPLPSSIYEAKQMNDKFIQGILRHESAIKMVRNSMRANRSCNEAIIFTYGLSGAGKTSTLNHIFGIDEITIKEHRQADTTLVSEYIATMKSEEWKVTNLEIGFIDVPGWNDTRGSKQDAINMTNIDYFINNHPYLGCRHFKCYPNIILITIDATNKRPEGTEASLTLMIRSLLKLRIVDKTRPNLLFVITNVHSIPKGIYKEELESLETYLRNISKEILGLQVSPEIVHIENKWKDHDLEKRGIDWTVLRDGTLQPLNVLEAMMRMTSRYKDEVGQEAIRIFSKYRSTDHPKCRRKSNPVDLPDNLVRKWENHLLSRHHTFCSNELNNVLLDYAQSQLDAYREPNVLNALIKELERRKITQLQQLQSKTMNQVKDLLHPYRIDEIEAKALIDVCGVTPYDIPHIIEMIGRGIDTEQRIITERNLFRLDDEFHVMTRLKIPKCMEAGIPIQTTRVRLKESGENPEAEGVKYQFEVIQCVCYIRLCRPYQKQLITQLSPAFKEIVAALPESSLVGESQQVRQECHDLFNTHGHFVIVACECGGVVQGDLELVERDTSDQEQQIVIAMLYNIVDKLESNALEEIRAKDFEGDSHELLSIQDSILMSPLRWTGGKEMREGLTLSTLTHKDWIQWVDSLSESPIPLDPLQLSDEKAVPLFTFVDLLDKGKSKMVKLAHETIDMSLFNIFGGITPRLDLDDFSDTISSISSNTNSVPTDVGDRQSFSVANISITVRREKNGQGYLGTSKVVKLEENGNYSRVEIQHLKPGDIILHRDRWAKCAYVQIQNITKETGRLRYKNIVHDFGESKIGLNNKLFKTNINSIQSFVHVGNIIVGDIIFCLNDKNKLKKSTVSHLETSFSTSQYSIQVEHKSLLIVDQIFVGDENEDPPCFPGNAIVTLRGGKKVRMDEVKVGDHVLSIHPRTGKPVYSKVYLWGHRDPHVTATFLHITHPHGHLHISANHLILSGEQRRPMPAGHLAVGDTIHSFLSPATPAISVSVSHIHACRQVGLYAPFTNNGLIVVDGIASSVYAHLPLSLTGGLVARFGMHRVGECVMTPVRVACKFPVGSLILNKQMDTTTHIHKYCQWLMKMYRYK